MKARIIKSKKKLKTRVDPKENGHVRSEYHSTATKHDRNSTISFEATTMPHQKGKKKKKKKKNKQNDMEKMKKRGMTDVVESSTVHVGLLPPHVSSYGVAASSSSSGESRKRKKFLLHAEEGTIKKLRRMEEQLDGDGHSQKKRKQTKQSHKEKKTVHDIGSAVMSSEELPLSHQVGLSPNEDERKNKSCRDKGKRVCTSSLDQIVGKKKKQRQCPGEGNTSNSTGLTSNENSKISLSLLDCSLNDTDGFQLTDGDKETREKKKKKKHIEVETPAAKIEHVLCVSKFSGDQETAPTKKKKKRKKKDTLNMLPVDSPSKDNMCDSGLDDDNIADVRKQTSHKHKKQKKKKHCNTAWDGLISDAGQTVDVASKQEPKSQKEKKKKKKRKIKSVQKQKFEEPTVSTDYSSQHRSGSFFNGQVNSDISCLSSDEEEHTRSESCSSKRHHNKVSSTLIHNKHGGIISGQLDEVLDLLGDDDDSPDEYESLHIWNATVDSHSRQEAYENGAKKGVFSKEEIDQISANVKRFCTRYSIKDPANIVIGGRSSSSHSRAMRSAFFQFACRHVPRTVVSVYRRLRRTLDDANYRGKFTEEESEQLDSLLSCHGSKWEMIGELMDRSGQSLIDHKKSVSDTKGSWNEQEEESLIMAIKWVAEQKGLQVEQLPDVDIPWTVVAKRVPGRTVVQCRSKWLLNLKRKFIDGRVKKWSKFDDVKLIDKVNECGATCFADVPWNDFVPGWPESGSFHKVRQKFWRLKQMVPDANAKTFEEIVSYLYESVKPVLLQLISPRYTIHSSATDQR